MKKETVDKLIRLLDELKSVLADELDLSEFPQYPSIWPDEFPVNPYFPENRRCIKCGMKLGNVMGYVCPVTNCPTFPQIFC